jgi:uncharacterized protein YoxC|tara:strand:+ start:79 stop:453 length:375 start_codon:yes stop_codon:yes gene_type:complete
MVRTLSAVVTAICLLTITIGFIVAGTWTIRSVHTLQSTYHPERLASMLETVEKTMDSVHQTSFILKSGKSVPIMDDIHRLVDSLESMSKILREMPVEHMVLESEAWRHVGSNLLDSVKKVVNEL